MLANLVAFLKAYEVTVKLIDRFTEQWIGYKDSQDSSHYSQKEHRRKILLNSIQGASSEDKAEIVRMLYELNHPPR